MSGVITTTEQLETLEKQRNLAGAALIGLTAATAFKGSANWIQETIFDRRVVDPSEVVVATTDPVV